jgi:protein required for attachment to host cells
MIYCKELNKSFEDRDEMLIELSKSLTDIIDLKKSTIKQADGYGVSITVEGATKEVIDTLKQITIKSFNQADKSIDYMKEANLPELTVTVVSNTTNFFDSHRDVHLDKMWNKTVADNKNGFDHLQEHKNGFANIISENCKTKILKTTFKELGFDYEGKTEALQHISKIDPIRNLFMYNQYANKWVKNHSVGMRYVGEIFYCANTEVEYMKEYKENWDKYYPVIANKADVDEVGYFWAVPQGRLMEFSAVPKGSNPITPTQNIEMKADKSLDDNHDQADKSLHTTEPPEGTQNEKKRRFI